MPPFAHIKFFTDCDDEVEQLYHQMLSAKKLGLALGLGPRMDDFDWPFSDAQEIEVSSSDSQFFGQLHPDFAGYDWYRMIRVSHRDHPDDQVILMVPWVMETDAHFLWVGLLGNPPLEWVKQIVEDFIWLQREAMGLVD